MIELLLTRHGETLENKRDIMQGHMPGTLSPLGIRQAEQLAGMLEDEKVDAIVSSDLARSYDTAKMSANGKDWSPGKQYCYGRSIGENIPGDICLLSIGNICRKDVRVWRV